MDLYSHIAQTVIFTLSHANLPLTLHPTWSATAIRHLCFSDSLEIVYFPFVSFDIEEIQLSNRIFLISRTMNFLIDRNTHFKF